MRRIYRFSAIFVAFILLTLLALALCSCGKKKKRPIVIVEPPPLPPASDVFTGPVVSNVYFNPGTKRFRPGETIEITANAYASHGGTLTYNWDVYEIGSEITGLATNRIAVRISGFSGMKSGSVTVTETLSTGESRTASRRFTITVEENYGPSVNFSAYRHFDLAPSGERAIVFSASVSDPEGDKVRINWSVDGGVIRRTEFYGGEARAWVVPYAWASQLAVGITANDDFGGTGGDYKVESQSPLDGAIEDSVWIAGPVEVRKDETFEISVYAWFAEDKPASQFDLIRILADESKVKVTGARLGGLWMSKEFDVRKDEPVSFWQTSDYIDIWWRYGGPYRRIGGVPGNIAVLECRADSAGTFSMSVQLEEFDRTVSYYSTGGIAAFPFENSGRKNLMGDWNPEIRVRVR